MRAAMLIAVFLVSGCVGIAEIPENAEGTLGAGYQPLPGGNVTAVQAPVVETWTFRCPAGATLVVGPNNSAMCSTPAMATIAQ